MDPKLDGVTHINIYSKGQTKLGRMLSNFAHIPVDLRDGHFESIEGYWYWLGTRDESLRVLYGFTAKQIGRSLKRVASLPEAEFQNKIREALRIKVLSHPYLEKLLKESELPFEHYYVFSGRTKDAGCKWLLTFWEQFRKERKEHPDPYDPMEEDSGLFHN